MTRVLGNNGVRVVWGCADFGGHEFHGQGLSADECVAALRALSDWGCIELDTARLYGDGKQEGALGAALRSYGANCFQIASKAHPKFSLAYDALLAQVETSLSELGLGCLDLLYLHSVDEDVPLEETLRAVNELHQAGKIREFGLSNFSGWQTMQVYYKCKEMGCVLPTCYQGNYNPMARQAGEGFLPFLHIIPCILQP